MFCLINEVYIPGFSAVHYKCEKNASKFMPQKNVNDTVVTTIDVRKCKGTISPGVDKQSWTAELAESKSDSPYTYSGTASLSLHPCKHNKPRLSSLSVDNTMPHIAFQANYDVFVMCGEGVFTEPPPSLVLDQPLYLRHCHSTISWQLPQHCLLEAAVLSALCLNKCLCCVNMH